MKIFIDSANLKQIEEANDMGIIDGVTTNPSLMAKESIGSNDMMDHYKKICEIVDNIEGHVSAEVISTKYYDIISEAENIASIHRNIVVKIPMTKDGVRAISFLSKKNIKTNCTLIFSPIQAMLAAKAGATYVSPFIGRLDDISHDGMDIIQSIRVIFDNYDFDTNILAASIRNNIHVLSSAELAVDVITSPFDVIKTFFNHPLTDIGLDKFLNDYKSLNTI